MVHKTTLAALLVGVVLFWTAAYAQNPDDCIREGRAHMFDNTLSGLRMAYQTFDDCLDDPLCPDCSSNRELVFLHALTRSTLLFVDNNDLVVNDSFLELAGAFGLVVQGDSFDPCDTNPVDVNVLMDLDGCYRIPPGAPDLVGIREVLDYSIIPEIDNIVAELNTIADSDVSRFRVFFEPNETGLQENLEVDYGEVLILKGLLLGFRGFLGVQLAYDFYLDVNDARIDSLLFNEGICPNDVNSLELSDFIDINDPNDNLSINEDLLGPYPDLLKVLPTLNFPDVNGTAILAQSAADLIAAVDYYLDALDYIVSEDDPLGTDPQEDELVYVDPNDRRFLDSINQKLIILRDSLAGDTVGVYRLETTKTYEVYNLSHIPVGELVLLYDLFGMEGEGGNLSFADGNSVPSPWEVEWSEIVDSNLIQIGLAHFSDGQWLGGYFEGAISPDCNTITGGTFEYWGYDSGELSGLSAQRVRTDVLDGHLDLNPLFGGSGRYSSPVNPRDLLAEFDQKNEPIAGTFGHGLGDNPTLGGIFPDMTQELWAILFDLPVPGLRFEEGFRFRVGEHPVSAALGDLNGDGFLDIVTANADSDDVSVLLGAGDGSFLTEQRYAVGEQPASITLGDLNGDKISDIVVANEGSNDVSVLLGLGKGRFQTQSRHATGLQPSGVAVGDVTGDGIADIVTSNRGSSNVCVLAGVGNGDMRSPVFIAVGGGPAAVALGDLNWDGKLDIVTADDWSCTISVLLALGEGQFDERRSLQAGGGPSSVVVGDLNRDGALDIVAGNIWSDDVTVALGNGDGTFEGPTSFDTAEGQFSVALGDVNGDGMTDIVTANTWADEISVLLGVGDGTFGRRSRFDAAGEPQCVLVGDLDADGIAEILTANGWSNDVSVFVSRCAAYGHYPSGSVAGPVGAVRFRFPHRMDTESFTLEQDLGSFVGPDGPIEPNGFLWINAQTLEIRFAPQYKYGSYRMAIGPHILDGYGKEMNADGDSLYGELIEDRYVATFMVLGHGDLVITSVEVQGHPTAGRRVAVSWDGLNADMENTIGQGFIDVVYLSANDEWDIDDIQVATIPHAEPLGPQEGYHRQTDVVLPGLQPGQYYVVVRTDPGNQIDEPNGENNNLTASDPIVVDVNRLTVGEELTDGFIADERERYYGVEVSGGEDLEIRLDDLDDMGANELYVSFGKVPSRSSYDYCYRTKFSPDQTLTVPDTRAGTYYAMAYAAGMGGSGYSEFTIGARYLPMEIRAVDPNKGGNMSSLPLGVQIKGAKFRSGATALLRRAGHPDIPATEVKVIDTSTIFAKLNLLGAAVGSWTMVVTNPDLDTAIFPFELFEGGNAKFEARLILPEALAFNRRAVLWIEYANSGDGPMLAPLLKLHGGQNALLTADKSLDGEGLWTDSPPPGLTDTVQVLALGSGQDCGILNPGDSGRIPIYYRGLKLPWDWSRPPIEFRLGVLTAETTTPIDWAEVEEDIKPCDVNESDWNSMFARLRDRIGPTWADYVAALTDNARRRARYGVITYDVRELFTEEIREAYGDKGSMIAGHVYRPDGNGDVAGASVIASQVDGNEVSVATTDSDGRFIMQFVPAGTYDLTVQGYFLAAPAQAEVAEGVDPCSLELAVDAGGSINGYVRTQDYWWADGASVAAVSATGEVFAATTNWGWYTINGVQPGTYTVRCEFESYVTEEKSDVSVATGQTVLGIDFVLAVGGKLSGIITDASSGLPIEGAQIALGNGNGMTFTAVTDSSGLYALDCIRTGSWQVKADHSAYLPSGSTSLTVLAGRKTTLDIALDPGGRAIVHIKESPSGSPVAGALVSVSAEGRPVRFAETDEKGEVVVEGLATDTYTVVVDATGRARAFTTFEATGSGSAEFDVEMEQEAIIKGTVKLSGDMPANGASVLATQLEDSPLSHFVTMTNEGKFALPGLSAGTYNLAIILEGYITYTLTGVTASAGMETDVGELVLVPNVGGAAPSVEGTGPSVSQQLFEDLDADDSLDYFEAFWGPIIVTGAHAARGAEYAGVVKQFLKNEPPNRVHRSFGSGSETVENGGWGRYNDNPGFRNHSTTTFLFNRVFEEAKSALVSRVESNPPQFLCDSTSGNRTKEYRLEELVSRSLLYRDGNMARYGEHLRWTFSNTLAGGAGRGGCPPDPALVPDRRLIIGSILVTVLDERRMEVRAKNFAIRVDDTFDFWCEGHLGDGSWVRFATEKLLLLERNNRAYDISFTVSWADETERKAVIAIPPRWRDNCEEPPDPNTDPIDGGDANSVGSFDPNKKLGPRGFGSGRYVRPGASMVYTVQFENEPNATAAAKKVRIVDQLDEDLDWTSFELLEIGFGPHNIVMPKGVSHHRTKTMVDGWTYRKGQGWSQNGVPMIVEVEAELDIETGQAVWEITAYDPETGWEPQDAYAGFLPPDDQDDATHRGEGFVRFFVRAKENLRVGTQIRNSASIVFDVNPAIETPETVNTILIDRGDLDLTGDIDLRDVALLVDRWLWVGPLGAVDQDITVDGVVNFLDLAAMVEK